MTFIVYQPAARGSFVLSILLLSAMFHGCGPSNPAEPETTADGGAPSTSSSTGGKGGIGGASGMGGMGGMAGEGGMNGLPAGSGGAVVGGTPRLAVLDDVTPFNGADPNGLLQDDALTVLDPANPSPPLLSLSGLMVGMDFGAVRAIGTSKSKTRLAMVEGNADTPSLRVFDQNLQPLFHVVLPKRGGAVAPTDNATFVVTAGSLDTGVVYKFDAQGTQVGTANGIPHGIDLVVDEDRNVVWTVGTRLTRVTTDFTSEQEIHDFAWAAVSIDLDTQGGVWVAERRHPQVLASLNQLVHFDAEGKLIDNDTLALPAAPMSVRFAPNSGFVWVAMRDAGIAYRNENAQLVMVPGLKGSWVSVEPDLLDDTRVWAANCTSSKIVHAEKNGFVILSLESFSTSCKWLATLLQAP